MQTANCQAYENRNQDHKLHLEDNAYKGVKKVNYGCAYSGEDYLSLERRKGLSKAPCQAFSDTGEQAQVAEEAEKTCASE